MYRLTSRILLGAGIFLLLPGTGSAQTDYQMLPPTYAGSSTPCTTGTGGQNQVMVFGGVGTGGQSAINCLNGGFTVVPSTGNVGVGTTTPNYTLEAYGATNSGNVPTVAAINGSTGVGANSQLLLATGTPYSYVSSTLLDNNGSGQPYYILGAGSAVTGGAFFNFPQLTFQGGPVTFTTALGLANTSGLIGSSCSTAGQLQYDAATDQPIYCSGTMSTWQSAAGGVMAPVRNNGTTFDWNAGNWSGNYWCDPGYTLVEYPTMNTNVAGHATATLAWFECIKTGHTASTGYILQSF